MAASCFDHSLWSSDPEGRPFGGEPACPQTPPSRTQRQRGKGGPAAPGGGITASERPQLPRERGGRRAGTRGRGEPPGETVQGARSTGPLLDVRPSGFPRRNAGKGPQRAGSAKLGGASGGAAAELTGSGLRLLGGPEPCTAAGIAPASARGLPGGRGAQSEEGSARRARGSPGAGPVGAGPVCGRGSVRSGQCEARARLPRGGACRWGGARLQVGAELVPGSARGAPSRGEESGMTVRLLPQGGAGEAGLRPLGERRRRGSPAVGGCGAPALKGSLTAWPSGNRDKRGEWEGRGGKLSPSRRGEEAKRPGTFILRRQ